MSDEPAWTRAILGAVRDMANEAHEKNLHDMAELRTRYGIDPETPTVQALEEMLDKEAQR